MGFVTDVAPLLSVLDLQLNASYGNRCLKISNARFPIRARSVRLSISRAAARASAAASRVGKIRPSSPSSMTAAPIPAVPTTQDTVRYTVRFQRWAPGTSSLIAEGDQIADNIKNYDGGVPGGEDQAVLSVVDEPGVAAVVADHRRQAHAHALQKGAK